jgi:hypothetical protein
LVAIVGILTAAGSATGLVSCLILSSTRADGGASYSFVAVIGPQAASLFGGLVLSAVTAALTWHLLRLNRKGTADVEDPAWTPTND